MKPNDDDDTQVKMAGASLRTTGPSCFAKAGDCDAAWSAWKEAWKLDPNLSAPQSRNLNDDALRHGFDAVVAKVQGEVGWTSRLAFVKLALIGLAACQPGSPSATAPADIPRQAAFRRLRPTRHRASPRSPTTSAA